MMKKHSHLHGAQDHVTSHATHSATHSNNGSFRSRSNRSGFALIVAIGLLAFFVVVMVCISQAFVTQAKRTKFESVDAQLRQMLIAGAGHAVPYRELELHKKEGASENWEVELPLPQKLKDQSAKLIMTSQPMPGGLQHVIIKATLGQSVASEQLTFISGKPGLVRVSAVQRRLVVDTLR